MGNCFYVYTKTKGTQGGISVKLKGTGCQLLGLGGDGFVLQVAENFWVESVNATPAAYNSSLGEFITRVFVPTSIGKVWRVDLSVAEYDDNASEGNMIASYTSEDIEYGWSISKDEHGDPVPWIDTYDYTGTRRPIMVTPALALNYKRNLVLYFGTGVIDDLSHTATIDHLFAVEETRTLTSVPTGEGEYYKPDPTGSIYCDEAMYGENCATVNPMAFGTAERLFGKPLVAAGTVFFTTYTPVDDECLPGYSTIYGLRFDDFNIEVIATEQLPDTGTTSSPTMVWTSTGPVIAIEQG